MTVSEDLVVALTDCQMLAQVQSFSCYYQLHTCDLHVSP